MNTKLFFSLSLSLTLVACQATSSLTSPAPVSQSVSQPAVVTAVSKPQLTQGMYTAQLTQVGETDTLKVQVRLPAGFRTQMVDASRLDSVRVTLTGDGISSPITQEGSAYLEVDSDNTATATLSGIPRSNGALRLIQVEGFDSDREAPLPGFKASGWYRSQTSVSNIDVVLNRVQNLLVDVLTILRSERPTLVSTLDIAATQTLMEEALGYQAQTGEMGTDPLRLDTAAVAALFQIGSPAPLASAISALTLPLQTVNLNFALPQNGVLDQKVRLVLNDPLSRELYLSAGTLSNGAISLTDVLPGDWTLSAYTDSGELLNSTPVSAPAGGMPVVLGSPLELTGVMELSDAFINTNQTGDQQNASMAMDDEGNFVVVWESDHNSGIGNIYGQRYTSTGVAQGVEFQINTSTGDDRSNPDVAMDDTGAFVVTWDNATGLSGSVYARRFDSAGVPAAAEFVVSSVADINENPSVSMTPSGAFVVTWRRRIGISPTIPTFTITAQRYDATGAEVGGEITADSAVDQGRGSPDVATDDAGNFVLTWVSNTTGSILGNDVFARRYDSAGTALAAAFRANTFTDEAQNAPQVAMDPDGNFVIVWDDAEQEGIYAQRYDSAGVAASGTEFRVNTFNNLQIEHPSVAMDDAGNFAIAWDIDGQDGYEEGIYAQRFTSSGALLGSEFRLNTVPYFSEQTPSLAMSSTGRLGVVWSGSGDYAGPGLDLFGKLYATDGTLVPFGSLPPV